MSDSASLSRGSLSPDEAVAKLGALVTQIDEIEIVTLADAAGRVLAADLLAGDCVDELQLTVVPRVLGGGNTWLPTTSPVLPDALSRVEAWRAEGAEPLGSGEWLLRYRRLRESAE